MMRKRITAIVFALAVIGLGLSEVVRADGNYLLTGCRDAVAYLDTEEVTSSTDKLLNIGHCTGFVQGFLQTNGYYYHIASSNKPLACPPISVTTFQAVRVLFKYLNEHPEMLHESEFLLIRWALEESFPCD